MDYPKNIEKFSLTSILKTPFSAIEAPWGFNRREKHPNF